VRQTIERGAYENDRRPLHPPVQRPIDDAAPDDFLARDD
jgi:hypothetical protein